MPKMTLNDLQVSKRTLDKKLAEVETELLMRRNRKGIFIYAKNTFVRPERNALEAEAYEALKAQLEAQRAQVLEDLAAAEYAKASGEYVERPRGWKPGLQKQPGALKQRVKDLAITRKCEKGISVPGHVIAQWKDLLNTEGFLTSVSSIRATLSDLGYAKERKTR